MTPVAGPVETVEVALDAGGDDEGRRLERGRGQCREVLYIHSNTP